MYKKCYATRLGKYGSNRWKIDLWDEDGHQEIEWLDTAYVEDSNGDYVGLQG